MKRLLGLVLLSGSLAAPAGAQVLDQYSPWTNTSFNMLTPDLNWQQEVVVGLGGALTRVDLFATAGGSCTFYITAGAPWQGGTPNYSTTVNLAGMTWNPINVSAAGLSFQPGDHLVLGFIGQNTGLNLGGSWRVPGGEYGPGRLFLNGANYADGNFDVAFKTYVVIPGPGSLALCAAGVLTALPRRR